MNYLKDKAEFLREIKAALKYFEVTRVVQRFDFYSFQNLLEHVTLTYHNLDKNAHSILLLPPISRGKQRYVRVFDGSAHELTMFPQHEVSEVLKNISNDYLDYVLGCIEIPREINEREVAEKVNKLKDFFPKIFTYGTANDIENEINEANRILKDIFQIIERCNFLHKKECLKSLFQVTYLVNIQRRFYFPFFQLEKSLHPKKHCIINFSTEGPKEFDKGAFFFIRGDMKYLFPLEPVSGASYHLRFVPPGGIDMLDFWLADLEGTPLIQKEYERDRYFQKTMLDISFPPPETREIRERIDSRRVPSVILLMRVSPLLCLLCYLVHVAVLSPIFIKILYGTVGLSEFIAFLALGATILLSVSIYAMDKKVIQEFVLCHLLIACTILIAELGVFVLFT